MESSPSSQETVLTNDATKTRTPSLYEAEDGLGRMQYFADLTLTFDVEVGQSKAATTRQRAGVSGEWRHYDRWVLTLGIPKVWPLNPNIQIASQGGRSRQRPDASRSQPKRHRIPPLCDRSSVDSRDAARLRATRQRGRDRAHLVYVSAAVQLRR